VNAEPASSWSWTAALIAMSLERTINALRTRQHTPSDLQNPGHHPFGSAPSRQLPYEALSVVQKFDLGVTAIGGVVGTGSGRITAYTEVMHLIAASNQAMEFNHPHKRRVRTVPGDAPTAFAISRKLAPCSRSRVIWSPLTIRRGRPNVFPLSIALRSPALTRS
jgi:hypothetical protein